jgi:lon-related putative ATP-dependent protease
MSIKELPVSKLRWHCPAVDLPSSTSEVHPSKDIIGQERALKALRLEMNHFGYNIFVTGLSGTGRTTTIKRLIHEFERRKVHLTDKCYVHNFKNPDMPRLLILPAGQGCMLKNDMDNFVNDLLKNIPSLFESKRYQEQRKKMLEVFQERQKSVLREFEKKVREQQFELIQVQVGSIIRPDIIPVINGTPTSFDQLEAAVKSGQFSSEELERLRNSYSGLEKVMETTFREMQNIERKAKDELSAFDTNIILPLIKYAINDMKEKYANDAVKAYLDDVLENVLSDLPRFRNESGGERGPAEPAAVKSDAGDGFLEYQVNVLVDNGKAKTLPIIIETNPRYKNIFGTIEREFEAGGFLRSDFMQIKAGSLLRADGGFLILYALDTLIEPSVWTDLKRTLRTSKLELHTNDIAYGISTTVLKPEPITLNVKVIMIGDPEIYQLLYYRDDDFKKIFKLRADFDDVMNLDKKSITRYASFIKMICDEEDLLPFDSSAIGAVVEYGMRLAGRQTKLSTRFNLIADVLREANYWARRDQKSIVLREHIEKAIEERIERVNLVEEKIQEMINEGTILINTQGKAIGQVNGLSVYDLGEYVFGRPSRITVKTGMGRAGLINIERESEMSGPTHNKGVLIIAGFMRSRFAQNKPLVMSASICFEQSYSGVDGDSASSTEIYALLSSLSEAPLRQDLAVTGSVNQNGEIQPIGGVNEKIEGFFDVCKASGLTGTQGVLIPHQDIPDLMLRKDVIEAVRTKKFHVYPIRTIDEGIELLTGMKAGRRRNDGTFEKRSINARVDAKLSEFARRWKELEETPT